MSQNNLKPNYSSSSSDEEDEPASGSENEQTSGSESEQSSDTASDKNQPKKTQTQTPPPKSTTKPHISSEPEDSGSGSETDSDSPPKKPATTANPNPNIKPIRSIPMQPESESAKKPGSKTGSTSSPARSKRVLSPANEKESKKAKGNLVITDEDSKKQLFQRLWSEDDEIVILKGMVDYKKESGESLIADMGGFYEFVKKLLHVDVSRGQLVDKIRRLKKKYVNNVGREKNGKDRMFSKSHEQKGYELSKLIWGSSSTYNNNSNNNNNDKSEKNGNVGSASTSNGLGMEGEKGLDISRFVRYGGRDECSVLPEEIVKAGMELVEGEKRVELEERWRGLKKEELELYLKKMELVKEQALIVLEAVNSSGN